MRLTKSVLEFLSKEASWEAYPSAKFQLVEPVTQFRRDGRRNKFTLRSWTDDSDHALLIILSYLHHDGRELLPNDLAKRLRTLPLGLGRTVGRVVLDKDFLGDPPLTAHKYWAAGDYHAAPNGSLMRTHPLGVICVGKTIPETFQTALDYSLVTHADPRCVVACCISTALIRGILRGEVRNEVEVDAIIAMAFKWVHEWLERGRLDEGNITKEQEKSSEDYKVEPLFDRTELYNHIAAKDFKELQLDDSMKMGYVYKSLGAAILALRLGMKKDCIQHIPNDRQSESFILFTFEEIITTLIMEGGDADTNASIAGALLGSWFGYKALPPNWREGIQHRDWLSHKCDALNQVVGITNDMPEYKGSEDADTKDDGGKGLLDKKALEARQTAFMEMYLTKGAEGTPAKKQKKGWRGKLFSS